MKYIFFFATPADIVSALRNFDANAPLKYVDPDIKPTPNRAIYLNSSQIPSLGIATDPSGSGSISYIVSHQAQKNHMHTFVDKTGQRRWMVSNGDNADSVVLTPAGIWTTGTLLPGSMSTLHQTAVAQQLMRQFQSSLRKSAFARSDIYWLGPEAMAMLRAGKRLAKNAEQSPPEFDLRLL